MKDEKEYQNLLSTINKILSLKINKSEERKAFILTGPSGVGKSSLFKEIYLLHPDFGQLFAYSDRPPRKSGDAKKCIPSAEFSRLLNDNQFALTFNLYGFRYGDKRTEVEEAFSKFDNFLLSYPTEYISDMVKLCIEFSRIPITVCILPPDLASLQSRLEDRPERIPYALAELDLLNLPQITDNVDYFLINDEFDKTVNRIKSILKENFN